MTSQVQNRTKTINRLSGKEQIKEKLDKSTERKDGDMDIVDEGIGKELTSVIVRGAKCVDAVLETSVLQSTNDYSVTQKVFQNDSRIDNSVKQYERLGVVVPNLNTNIVRGGRVEPCLAKDYLIIKVRIIVRWWFFERSDLLTI